MTKQPSDILCKGLLIVRIVSFKGVSGLTLFLDAEEEVLRPFHRSGHYPQT